MDVTTARAAVHAAGVAELLWPVPGGPPGAAGVVPLLLDDRPAVQAYEPGSWGPQAALDLPDGGWRLGRTS